MKNPSLSASPKTGKTKTGKTKTAQTKTRILEIDFFRGLAVIGMVIFHFLFILDFYDIRQTDLFEGGWDIFGQFIRFTFLLLVGISITFSRSNLKRSFIVLGAALIITLATYLAWPDLYIRFGILHFIAASIFLLSPLRKYPYISLAIAMIAIFITYFLSNVPSTSLPLIILGFKPLNFSSLDYFPIFPWITLPAFGIFLGNTVYKNKRPLISNEIFDRKIFAPLYFLGRHGLVVYMLHVPLIFAILMAARIIPPII